MDEREQLKQWVDTWQRVGPKLERIRREELQNWDQKKTWRILDDLIAMALQHAPPPKQTSGLVEQQRLFRMLGP